MNTIKIDPHRPGATIEAARAGEGVQSTTESTVITIDEISKVIHQVNDLVAGIATAVEEQSAATSEIADSISMTSSGIQGLPMAPCLNITGL